MSTTLRRYRTEDFDRLIQLIRKNAPEAFAPEEELDFKNYLQNKIEDYFVWEDNGEILAGAGLNYFPAEKEIRLSWDMVAPEAQGKGIGLAMFQYRLKHVISMHQYLKLVVRTSQIAFQFYEKRGFHLVYSEKDYWAKGYDMYYMTMTLR